MKKTIVFILILILALASASAYSDSLLQFDTPLWLELEKRIKCNDEPDVVEECYWEYISRDITPYERARAEYNLCRYYADRGESDKSRAAMAREKEALEDTKGMEAPLALMAEMDYSAAVTYLEKSLSTGLENSNLTKKAYKEYPEEVYMVVVNAWRLIYTPQIAGGSNKNAIKILEPLLEEKLSKGNLYSIYGALAMAHYNRKDYKIAMEYLDKAFAIYDGEITLLDLKDKLEKKLK